MSKIQQYKVLFPENKHLKSLKIKKNPTVAELQAVLGECEAIVETGTVESFVTDSVINSISMAELMSSRTKYNIKGLSARLKKNPQFTALCKQLYLKYKVFSKIPPELSLVLMISITAVACYDDNKKAIGRTESLNTEIDPNQFT